MEQPTSAPTTQLDRSLRIFSVLVALAGGAVTVLLIGSGPVPFITFPLLTGIVCGALARVRWAVLAVPAATLFGGLLASISAGAIRGDLWNSVTWFSALELGAILLIYTVAPAMAGTVLGILFGRRLLARMHAPRENTTSSRE